MGKPLGETLIALGFVEPSRLTEVVAEAVGAETTSLVDILPQAEALALIPKHVAQRHCVFPLRLDGQNRLYIATADTHDVIAIDQVGALLGPEIKPHWRLAPRTEILDAIERFYGYDLSIDGILRELETGQIDTAEILRLGGSYAHPIVRLVSSILTDAVMQKASDIHFGPEPAFLRIRYRIDGVLHEIRSLHISIWSGMLVRLKVLSGMDIAETRAPQDGRISLSVSGRTVDFRAATQPTLHGENFVLRILDRAESINTLDQLGLSPEHRALIEKMLSRPEGILLVTGPTGSGKTTTLYSFLAHLNSPSINIMTLEDPVEYPLPLVRQTSVSQMAKIDFASGIRSLLRQDPDVILVGEIRDSDTAEMAFRAAMTGHQVLSTLHTNSALRSIPRLIDLGVHRDVMAGNIIGIIAQRLVRKLCPDCRRAVAPDDRIRKIYAGAGRPVPEVVYEPVGCPNCRGGYRGRMALMEIVHFSRTLDDLIVERAPLGRLEAAARAEGFMPIAYDGLARIAQGVTSFEEVARVIDLTFWH